MHPSQAIPPSEKFDPQAPDPRRPRRWLPRAGLGLLVLLIAAGLWPRALPVETVSVGRGELRVTIDEEGQTRVRNRYVVASPAAGQLRRITLRPGDAVRAGETVLAELETAGADVLDARGQAQAEAGARAARSALDAARAREAAATTARVLAETERDRVRELAARRLVSTQELDTMEARATTAAQDARAAMFAVQVAKFELEQAQAALLREASGADGAPALVIKSPVNGVVLRVFQESARRIAGGVELLEIGDPADLEVRVEVLSRDGVAIAPGSPVTLERWGGEGALQARVRRVEP
ncbi:MAG: HlyD family efflux transporter periplasmic adaptor subunit, partial [Opitutaceae bacterium]|nr:HlyD family efflux transporter periplasmic adaptor subunit [Opitutaceae bacterium]